MNSDTPESSEPTASVPDAADAPKKRTRTRKPAVSVTPDAAAASVPHAADPTEPSSESDAPVRKPRSRKAATPASDAAVPSVAPVDAAAPIPVVAVHSAEDIQEGDAADVREAGVPGDSGDEGAGRGRNRRRGRRGSRGEADGRAPREPGAGVVALPVPDVGEVFASLLAGDFDGELDAADAPAVDAELVTGDAGVLDEGSDKRVLLPDVDAPKLHKVLAQSGVGSRRDMEQMIQEGRVSVNDEVAHTGMRVSFGDRVTIDGKPVRIRIAPPPARVIAYHKPVGEVVTHDDPQQRPTVFRKLPRLSQGKWQSVGRLDINTEGLLLFTTSGDLANKLMHPRFGVEREYAVRVLGTLEKPAKERLLAGVEIEGQAAAFKSVEDGGGEGVNHWYRVVITEGRNREVRRLFEAVGLTVSRLIRIRYGCVVLPRGLKRGACVDLGEADVKALRLLTGSQASAPRGDRGAEREERAPRGGDRPARSEARQEGRRDGGRAEPRQEGRGDGRAEGRADGRGDGRADGRADGRRDGRPQRGPGQAVNGGPAQAANGRRKERPQRDDRGNQPRGHGNGNGQGRGSGGDYAPAELREPGDPSRIPNPLQQTYDKRAIQRERNLPRFEDELENGPIPNPLQQTYDKRFVQAPRGAGGNARGRGGKPGKGGGGDQRQPDPMQTSVGYIGADAFTRKMQGRGGGGGGGRGRR